MPSKAHLNYPTVRHFQIAQNIDDWQQLQQTDPQRFQQLFEQRTALQDHLWKKHIASLPRNVRKEFEAGTWVSQDWNRADQAEPYLKQLDQQLSDLECIESMELGLYHGGTIIISILIKPHTPTGAWLDRKPQHFMGFQVRVHESADQ